MDPALLFNETKRQTTSNYCKWHGKKLLAGYDRPGRGDKAEKRYRRSKDHYGKSPTLRDHRTG